MISEEKEEEEEAKKAKTSASEGSTHTHIHSLTHRQLCQQTLEHQTFKQLN